ncbi:MAG: hypothetical protein AB2392_03420 [Neobacillus sp.]|jgi:hypothetical protein
MERDKFLIPEEIHLQGEEKTINPTNSNEIEDRESLLLTGGGDPNLSPDAGKPMI